MPDRGGWRAVPGTNVEVSARGDVRTVGSSRLRRLSSRQGYLVVGVQGRTRSVHDLVLRAFAGPPPEGQEALHGNGVRDDNRIENLRWGTRAENVADSLLHGTNRNAAKVACKRGHPFDSANTYVHPTTGSRQCRACQAEYMKGYRR